MIFDRIFSTKSTAVFDASMRSYLDSGLFARSSAGVTVTPMRAMQHAAVFSCVRVLAESVGQLPLHLYKLGADGKSKEKALDHDLYDVLATSPNSYMTAQEFAELEVVHLALRGNFYGWKNVVRGETREILPLNPDAVQPRLLLDNSDVLYDVTFPNGKQATLDSSEVYHVKLFSTDGIRGLSPISMNAESIGLSIAAEKHGAKLFANNAMPGGILSTPQALKKEAYERVRNSWNEIHQGTENAHKVAILEAGMTWTKTGLTAEEAQFLETRKYSRSEIAGIFRVPPHKIGDLSRSTNNNIEQQSLDLYSDGLLPYLTRIENRTRFSLLRPSDRKIYFAKFDVRGLLRADMASKGTYYDSMVRNGAMSPNEIREQEDFNPRAGGDIYLTPSNMSINGQPVGQANPNTNTNPDGDPAPPEA